MPQQLRYRGYWFDGELGWYWLDTRSYDPEGRFLQPDPTALDGVHTYVYADDDPVDLMEVGGAFGFGDFFHAAVDFVSTAAHIVYKIAERAWNLVAGDDIHTICCTNAPIYVKALAGVDLAITILPGADVTKLVEVGVKAAAKDSAERGVIGLVRWVIGHTVGRIEVSDGTIATAIEERATKGAGVVRAAEKGLACALCFPAGTQVATPHGERAIQTLHIGDTVLAEDPTTGKVAPEPVQAVIQDPVSPLIAVQLSDGSAITVTADHPFWVEAGADFARPGWLAAGTLRVGDELRTASGVGVMVTGLRWQAGHAAVYTLTVAKDHTFFVGAARVLVHNADCLQVVRKIIDDAKAGILRRAGDYHGRLPEGLEREILSNPARVYESTSNSRRLIFADDSGNVVVTEGTGSGRGNILTSYGPGGPRGTSGAASLGGLPTDPGEPVTHEMIVNGQIPAPGGRLPPAVQIYP